MMMIRLKIALFAAATLIGASISATSIAAPTNITGSIYFGGGFENNGYDPANGGVPPGYGNESSNTVAVGPGTEFGFQDQFNRDTADFSSSGIVIEDQVLNTGASEWQQTFAASSSGFFDGLQLVSNSFTPGLTYSVSGNTLTVDWPGEYETGSADYVAKFSLPSTGSVSAAPEPASWALMLGGVGVLGGLLRVASARRREDGATGMSAA